MGIITLTTDFGQADGYVAAMKGVILSINPQVQLVDISHSVRAQDVAGGAFVLGTAYPYFPAGTVHLAVVDPGVGTERRGVILSTPQAQFVAPDNGLLDYVLDDLGAGPAGAGGQRPLPPGTRAFELTNPARWRQPVSATFHGRDIFAPVAAYLSRGEPPQAFGRALSSLVGRPRPCPRQEAGRVCGQVVHVDGFGNLITNITRQDLPGRGDLTIVAGEHTIRGLSRTYAGTRGPVALIGSSGRLEIAVNGASARAVLGLGTGAEVVVTQNKRRQAKAR